MSTQKLIREFRARARVAGKNITVEPASKGVAILCEGNRIVLPHSSCTIRKARFFSKILGL